MCVGAGGAEGVDGISVELRRNRSKSSCAFAKDTDSCCLDTLVYGDNSPPSGFGCGFWSKVAFGRGRVDDLKNLKGGHLLRLLRCWCCWLTVVECSLDLRVRNRLEASVWKVDKLLVGV